MTLFLMSVLIFGLSVAAMSIGAALGRPPLGGGCGSARDCEGCARPCGTRGDRTEP